jgi:hypothetical protein
MTYNEANKPEPRMVGAKVTLRVEHLVGCAALPQLLLWAKSPGVGEAGDISSRF